MTTHIDAIAEEFGKSIASAVEVEASGLDRYVVHVPMTFADGDHYVVVLRGNGSRWRLSDEGHTLMHLSYEIEDPRRGNRGQIIDSVVDRLGLSNRDGALEIDIRPGKYGDTLFTYLQAITQINDVSYLRRERVRSTFMEDFRTTLEEAALGEEIEFGYSHPIHDPDESYPVDARLNGSAHRPVVFFAISSDDKCRDATITLYRWREWQEKFWQVTIFEDQTRINRRVLARFSDVADKQYSNLESARRSIGSHVGDLVSGGY